MAFNFGVLRMPTMDFCHDDEHVILHMTEVWQAPKLKGTATYDSQLFWLFDHLDLARHYSPGFLDEVWVWSAPKRSATASSPPSLPGA